MKTIVEEAENELIIKNSRFITKVFKVKSTEEVISIIKELKEKYPKANHYCYAYRLFNSQKASDDKEPAKTAGAPILNVLEKEDLYNILVVVIRYFGGIKLGAGGLIRAYSKSTIEALKLTQFSDLVEGVLIEMEFPYSLEKEVNFILKNEEILKKEFREKIYYQVLLEKNKLYLLEGYNYNIIKNMYKEKSNL